MRPYLSVVIPAYNEEENIKKGAAKEVLNYLRKQKYLWEVIFVDDGSQDETGKLLAKIAKKYSSAPAGQAVRLIKNPHQGKAATVITGMLAAKGAIVLFTDMDQATPINQLEKFFPYFENQLPDGSKGYDVVIGSRKGRHGAPLIRKLMAYGFAFLRNLLLGLPFSDTQCGFKAFKREAVAKIFPNLKIYGRKKRIVGAAVTAGFDIEVLYLAKKLGLKTAEVPVEWQYKGTGRVNPLRDSLAGLRGILAVKKAYRA